MRAEIALFLSESASIEVQALLESAFPIFDVAQAGDPEERMLEILMADGDVAKGDTLSSIMGITSDVMAYFLSEHQIVMNEETPLEVMIKTASAVMGIQNYDDASTLIRICESQISNEDKFAEMAELVSNIHHTVVLQHLESVSSDLIKAVFIMHKDEDDKMVATGNAINLKLNAEIISALEELNNFKPIAGTAGYILLENNVVLGMKFSLYYPHLAERLDTLEPMQAAHELLVLMTMSADARENPVVFFREHSDTMFTALDTITKVDQELGKLVIGLDTFTKNKVDLKPSVKTILVNQGVANE